MAFVFPTNGWRSWRRDCGATGFMGCDAGGCKQGSSIMQGLISAQQRKGCIMTLRLRRARCAVLVLLASVSWACAPAATPSATTGPGLASGGHQTPGATTKPSYPLEITHTKEYEYWSTLSVGNAFGDDGHGEFDFNSAFDFQLAADRFAFIINAISGDPSLIIIYRKSPGMRTLQARATVDGEDLQAWLVRGDMPLEARGTPDNARPDIAFIRMAPAAQATSPTAIALEGTIKLAFSDDGVKELSLGILVSHGVVPPYSPRVEQKQAWLNDQISRLQQQIAQGTNHKTAPNALAQAKDELERLKKAIAFQRRAYVCTQSRLMAQQLDDALRERFGREIHLTDQELAQVLVNRSDYSEEGGITRRVRTRATRSWDWP
jgi:hypothetical protein